MPEEVDAVMLMTPDEIIAKAESVTDDARLETA